ncbi:MAG TPA: GAF domain-containing SpoIIE family protein phosphatase [Bacteroidota bacterium]|nr:GAF domain-containing SpoIIE family protein phosphatase [Bacteroidota bacterium]
MSLVRTPSVLPTPSDDLRGERTHRLLAWLSLSDRINVTGDLYAMMRSVVEGAMSILHATAGLLMIAGGGMYSKSRDASASLLRLEEALREDEPGVLASCGRGTARGRELSKDLAVIPIYWQTQVVGLLAFDLGRRRLVNSERSLLRIVANQLGAVIGARAQTPDSSLGSLQGTLQEAAHIQQSLLPSLPSSQVCGLSVAAFTLPAQFVGGDYYDLICVDQRKLGIVIADIQGKGVSAALFGNMLRTTTHFLTHETPSPAVLLGKINTILHREAASARKLFTMFYGIYDAESRLLTYSGSGHIPPIVVPADGGEARRLRSDGTLLGISSQQRFEEYSVHLATGDILVLFTDGVVEHSAGGGKHFGEERLIRSVHKRRGLEPEAILNGVKEDLSEFAPLPSADDMTIVLTKVA